MAGTDRNELRRTGLEIFITNSANAKKTLGAVEFGSTANTVFAPGVVGSQRSSMVSKLRQLIDADNGGTDYNSGFLKAASDNPNAQARIFLTDGADNGGFTNTHRGGPRTYVVGLSIGAAGPGQDDANRLQLIADETGGRYFPNVTAAKLQTTFNTISSAVNCLQAPKSFTSKVFTSRGQSSTKTTSLASITKSADLVLNWAQPTNKFKFSGRPRARASEQDAGDPLREGQAEEAQREALGWRHVHLAQPAQAEGHAQAALQGERHHARVAGGD